MSERHLIWIVPVVLVVELFSFALAQIGWCQLSDCAPPRTPGLHTEPYFVFSWAVLAIGGAITWSILQYTPWTERVRVRRTAAIAVALGATAGFVIALLIMKPVTGWPYVPIPGG